jgi:hypothetical protein
VEWEGRAGAAQASNKVVLPGSDGFFVGVRAVQVWRHELVVDALIDHGIF